MSKDLVIRISHRLRILFYIVGIIILTVQLTFDVIGRAREKVFVDRVRYHAQHQTQEYRNFWLGIEMQQFATDLMSYADLIYRLKPEVVIETGTYKGGLTVYLATVMERVSPSGKVITVDIVDDNWNRTVGSNLIPADLQERIVFIKGDSVSDTVTNQVALEVNSRPCLVILDSYHAGDHVLKELQMYSKFVPVGGYIIVNDTNLEEMGAIRENLITRLTNHSAGRGPLTAVKRFLQANKAFQIDEHLPSTLISCAPSGFLKRIRT